MKSDLWASLQALLEQQRFIRHEEGVSDPSVAWFVHQSSPAVSTHIRFVFKKKLRVATAHLGWRHEPTHAFCLAALKFCWPAGFAWLSDAGVVSAPCLLLFNLANHMAWPLAGMPIGGPSVVSGSAETRFGEVLSQAQWTDMDAETLLNRYVNDQNPFGWRDGNAALRLAHIAGLLNNLKGDRLVLDQCAADHMAVIQSDMFNLGSASQWIDCLRSGIVSDNPFETQPRSG